MSTIVSSKTRGTAVIENMGEDKEFFDVDVDDHLRGEVVKVDVTTPSSSRSVPNCLEVKHIPWKFCRLQIQWGACSLLPSMCGLSLYGALGSNSAEV